MGTDRQEVNQVIAEPLIKSYCIRLRRMEWSMMSKVVLRSRRRRMVREQESEVRRRSLVTLRLFVL